GVRLIFPTSLMRCPEASVDCKRRGQKASDECPRLGSRRQQNQWFRHCTDLAKFAGMAKWVAVLAASCMLGASHTGQARRGYQLLSREQDGEFLASRHQTPQGEVLTWKKEGGHTITIVGAKILTASERAVKGPVRRQMNLTKWRRAV